MNSAMATRTTSFDGSYVFSNGEATAAERLQLLAQIYDPISRDFLQRVGIAQGWSCWEVGAGYGTIARWMHERVGQHGRVLATDLDPRFLQPLACSNFEVMQHEVVRDPLPSQQFDLIHARLLICHLPEREAVLDQLIGALKPGGWLVIEDFDASSLTPDPNINPAEVLLETGIAMRELLRRKGVHLGIGRLLAGQFRTRGLRDVIAEGRMSMWHDGSMFARFQRLTYEQVAAALIESGLVSAEQIARDIAALEKNYAMPSPILWSVAGRRA
jgi:SAM-dependent methyltransferase